MSKERRKREEKGQWRKAEVEEGREAGSKKIKTREGEKPSLSGDPRFFRSISRAPFFPSPPRSLVFFFSKRYCY